MTWTVIDTTDAGVVTSRASVEGGWLILVTTRAAKSSALTFLPDTDHNWTP